VKIGKLVAQMNSKSHDLARWSERTAPRVDSPPPNGLVNIQFED